MEITQIVGKNILRLRRGLIVWLTIRTKTFGTISS